MITEKTTHFDERVRQLVAELKDPDGLQRQKARLDLINLGIEVVPALTEVLEHDTGIARWEAIKALGRLKDPSVAPALVEVLRDDSMNIRWAASNALIELDRAAIAPLLISLTKHFDSPVLREAAHHILHVLKTQKRLLPKEIKVFEALEGIEPAVEVPWAVHAALSDEE